MTDIAYDAKWNKPTLVTRRLDAATLIEYDVKSDVKRGRTPFSGGALAAAIPIAPMGFGAAAASGAAAGFFGSVVSQTISGTGFSGIDWVSATQAGAAGAIGGAVGNLGGLASALANVRSGMMAQPAIQISKGVATGFGVVVSTGATAGTNELSNPCSCTM